MWICYVCYVFLHHYSYYFLILDFRLKRKRDEIQDVEELMSSVENDEESGPESEGEDNQISDNDIVTPKRKKLRVGQLFTQGINLNNNDHLDFSLA